MPRNNSAGSFWPGLGILMRQHCQGSSGLAVMPGTKMVRVNPENWQALPKRWSDSAALPMGTESPGVPGTGGWQSCHGAERQSCLGAGTAVPRTSRSTWSAWSGPRPKVGGATSTPGPLRQDEVKQLRLLPGLMASNRALCTSGINENDK